MLLIGLPFLACGGQVTYEETDAGDDCRPCREVLLGASREGLCGGESTLRLETLDQCVGERCASECPDGLEPGRAACVACYEVECHISVQRCEVS